MTGLMKATTARLMFAFVCLLTAAVLGGCRLSAAGETRNDTQLLVVATIFPPYDFSREIAGGMADITMLLPPGAEVHHYEPTPHDLITLRNCDLFLYVGGESDAWVDDMLASLSETERERIQTVTLMDCVEPLYEEVVDGMQADTIHSEDSEAHTQADSTHSENAYDEHIWTSPLNAKRIVQKISEAMCEADPANKLDYQRNTEAYLRKLDELDATFTAVTENPVRRTIVFGDRFPFRYLADAYKLDYYAAFPGCSSETEASAKTVRFLIDKVREESVPVVFMAEPSGQKTAQTIAEATGAKVMRLNAGHTVTKDDFEQGVTYLTLMTKNGDALREALN